VEKLAATSVEEDNELTVEEKLKLREEKKQKLKAQLEAEKAAIESNDTRSTDVSDVNLTAARRPLQRSMQSLIHLKVLVETQVEDIEHAPKKVCNATPHSRPPFSRADDVAEKARLWIGDHSREPEI
jgi:hypothetical protein